MAETRINVATEFSRAPIGRYLEDSDVNGTKFREEILLPKFTECLKNKEILVIDFGGMLGLSSSWLEEAFGGLVCEHNFTSDDVLATLKFIPEDGHLGAFIKFTKEYIQKASK